MEHIFVPSQYLVGAENHICRTPNALELLNRANTATPPTSRKIQQSAMKIHSQMYSPRTSFAFFLGSCTCSRFTLEFVVFGGEKLTTSGELLTTRKQSPSGTWSCGEVQHFYFWQPSRNNFRSEEKERPTILTPFRLHFTHICGGEKLTTSGEKLTTSGERLALVLLSYLSTFWTKLAT